MGPNNKLITFIGLFFLASISLHSFAHAPDRILEVKPQAECQACKHENPAAFETLVFYLAETLSSVRTIIIAKTFYPKQQKYFSSRAPPKI